MNTTIRRDAFCFMNIAVLRKAIFYEYYINQTSGFFMNITILKKLFCFMNIAVLRGAFLDEY
jgi:hypothetical protein